MWTNIFLFLWIISTVIYRSTPLLTKCSKRVQRCPVKKDQWAQKNDLLNCTSFGYVCLRDANGYLYESCMANFRIRANLGNCPTLFACRDNKPFLGTDTTFYHCPEDVSGCPPRNHAEYSIHQLYKYPKCIESNFSYEMENTSPTSTTSMASKGSSDLNSEETKRVVIPLVITLVLVALLGCFIGYILYSRKKKYDYSKVKRGDTERPFEGLRCWIHLINESEADKVRILPLKEDDTKAVDRIYVPVSIVDEDERRMTGTTDKPTIPEITPDKFFNIAPGKPARFIFMLGDAGYGKTVQCQRIAKSWCKAGKTENIQSKKFGNTENDKEWEKSLKEFDFLFFVPMRDLNVKHECVDDMLHDYYRRFDTSHQYIVDIRTVLKDERYKCLIILDGLDEWNISESMKKFPLHRGIPNCEGMPNCTFLITMRYWRFMEVDPLCRKGLFDKVVRLHGLNDVGIEELTTNMLCNNFNIDRDSEEFQEKYESIRKKTSSSPLKSMMKIPLLALFCILTWHEDIESGHSLTTFYLSMIEALIKRSLKREQIGQKGRDDTNVSVPTLLKGFPHVTNHMPEISLLGKLAFKNLASQSTNFVSSDEQLKQSEVKETLDLFLRIGLLSKNDASGQIHEDNVQFSFLHKTIQEFLYSLNLVHNKSEESITKYLCNEISDIGKALEFSTVLTFVSGFSPAVGCKISNHIAELSSQDVDIKRFRNHFSTETYNKMFDLFNLQLSCYREVREWKSIKDYRNSRLVFSLSDVILLGNDMDKLTIRESADVLRYHAKDIKSLCMKFVPNDSDEGITNIELTEFLHESESLVALDIDGYDRGKCRLFNDSSKRIPCLRTLGLFNVAFTDNILTDFLTKDESKRGINALGLFYIRPADDLEVNFQYQLASVHRLSSVRSGYVQKRIMPSSSENSKSQMKGNENKEPLLKAILEVLPKYKNLTILHVSYMDSEEDREMFLQVLPEIKTLQNFGYDGSSIYPNANNVYDTAVIRTLLNIKQLQQVFLNDISLNEDVLNFEPLSELKRVTLEVFMMDKRKWSTFVSSLSKIENLCKVILNDTNIDDENLSELESSCPSLNIIKDESTEWC